MDRATLPGYVGNIEEETLQNTNFRRVIFTGPHSQLVVMSLEPREEIGLEAHEGDQFIRFEEGEGRVVLDGNEAEIRDDYAVVIPAGTVHNVINTSADRRMKLYAIYSPPEHPDGIVHRTRAEAEEYEKEQHGGSGARGDE